MSFEAVLRERPPQEERIFKLCDIIRETSFEIHKFHKHGHLEKVYGNALAHRLKKLNITVEQQIALPVFDEDGELLGDYYADLLVEDILIVEIKACNSLIDEHIAQLLGYLRSSRIEHGLLINFGSSRLQIKKFALSRE
ncbi:MAG: GxxExxY protein [Pyrinomonadaceae bacterium]